MLLILLCVCLTFVAAAPQVSPDEYYVEYEYYEDYPDYLPPKQANQAAIPVQEVKQEAIDNTPIFVGNTKLKEKVPLVCVSCRSQADTTRAPQKINNVIKGTQDEFGHDGRDKVNGSPENNKRAQVSLGHALKSAQDAFGKDGRDKHGPKRKLTKIKSTKGRVGISGTLKSAQDSLGEDGRLYKSNTQVGSLTKVLTSGRVGLSGTLKSAQDSFGDDGREGFASIPERGFITGPTSRKRVSLSGSLRSAQSALKKEGGDKVQTQTSPSRGLTKINPRKRISALQAGRASQGGSQSSEGVVKVTQKPRTRTRTRLQVGRTKSSVRNTNDGVNVKTEVDSVESRPRSKPRTRVRMRDATKLRRQQSEEILDTVEEEAQS